jgi:hypothetical protein
MPGDSGPATSLALARRLAALIALIGSPTALAQQGASPVADTPKPSTSPVATTEPEPEPWTKLLKLEGAIDTYFSYNFAGMTRVPSTIRVFDADNATFNVAYAEVALGIAPKPVGFRLDLGFGPVADLTSYDAVDPTTAPGVSEILKHFQQAYGSLAIGGGGWTLDAGKFVTTAGAEVIEAHVNWNYSRSLLFGFAIPFTHTGLRLGGPLTDTLSLQVSLVNGWEVVHDNNPYKTVGLSGTFAPPTGTTATLTVYVGPEGDRGAPWRNLVDVVVLQKIGDQLTLGLNGDYAVEGDASWYGAALMANYKFSPMFRLAARAEQFYDLQDARLLRGVGAVVTEGTLTAGFATGDHAEIRAEIRGDTADQPIFNAGRDNSQATAQVAFLAWF